MEPEERQYIASDLKSFYASVECHARHLNPLTARLLVADESRTDKTICLAVSPALKAIGVPSRPRLFEAKEKIRLYEAATHTKVDYIIAPPRMAEYIRVSAQIYEIYLRYVSEEDIHVYSVDEAFMDVTHYLSLYKKPVRDLAVSILKDIKDTLGLTATCGIGTNLYLAKIALDITAKHADDFIGELTEETYKEQLWDHQPLTDFWMVGRGTVSRLARVGIFTMRDIAMADEALLFRLFGVNAEILMDHAWGIEPVTMADIKKYRAKSRSISSGQVLARDYNYKDCRLIVKEMCDLLCLELVKQHKITDHIALSLGFSFNLDRRPLSVSEKLTVTTSSNRILTEAMMGLFDRIADPALYYRRVNLSFDNLKDEEMEQMDLFTDPQVMAKDRKLQQAALDIKERYGKNALLKGMNLEDAGTTIERNGQVGGHRG